MIYLLQAISILSVQLLMIYLYTKPMARFQAPVVKGMIDYWPPVGNPYTAPFHRYGWQLAFCFGFLITLIHAAVISSCALLHLCSWWKLITCICTPALIMLWHWKVFDQDMGLALHQYKYYIGGTSQIDQWLTKKYGADAGVKKDRLALGLLAAGNILFITLNVFLK